MTDYFIKKSGDTKVLQGSTTGFILANQSSQANQQFDPNTSSFSPVTCANGKYWKYDTTVGVKLVAAPMGDNAKFKLQLNGGDYQVYCKGVNNGTTPLTIAGANKFALQPT